jgi:hypothetical protein
MLFAEEFDMLTSKKCYVYGFRNIENGMMNIGYKSPRTDKLDYISSISNPQFWEDYYKGKVEKFLLFEGTTSQDDLAQTIEWFGLNYGMSWNKSKFYNKSNNAHCVDESLLTDEHKQLIVDWIESRSDGVKPSDRFVEDKSIVTTIHDSIKSGFYKVVLENIKNALSFDRNQIRVEQIDVNHVRKIKSRFDQNPKDAWDWLLKDPVVVVVSRKKNKISHTVLNGNNRLAAVSKTALKEIPVVYINETEFGADEETRSANYDLFGLLENKEDFVVRKTNTDGDIKRNINNFLVRENIDLSDPLAVDTARELIYERFTLITEDKKKLNGIFRSILNDFATQQNALKYQDNLIAYDDQSLNNYKMKKYELKGVAAIHATASKAEHAVALGYIVHRMFNVKKKKGAIVLYFKNKNELAIEDQEKHIDKLRDMVNYMQLDITIDVLPAFNN